jgi:hypothetical protein
MRHPEPSPGGRLFDISGLVTCQTKSRMGSAAFRDEMTDPTDRISALHNVREGDIIHGTSPRGVSLVCFVKAVTKDEIITRRITGETIIFTRGEGISAKLARIDSVAPVPPDIRSALIGLDAKHDDPSASWILTPEERRALIFVGDFYRAHPI